MKGAGRGKWAAITATFAGYIRLLTAGGVMSLSERDLWTVIHGMGLGAVFLLAFAGGLAELWDLRAETETGLGLRRRLRRLVGGTWTMAVVAWLTVITGTFIVYPWYRAKPPAGASLADYPRSYLLADPSRSGWHHFGMEWKEHVAWLSPILATAVAFVVLRYGRELVRQQRIRQVLVVMFSVAFFAAAAAGVFGAFINKVAPTR
jgi:hypothetical protein